MKRVVKKGVKVQKSEDRPPHIGKSLEKRRAYLVGRLEKHGKVLQGLKARLVKVGGVKDGLERGLRDAQEEFDKFECQHDVLFMRVKGWERELAFIVEVLGKI